MKRHTGVLYERLLVLNACFTQKPLFNRCKKSNHIFSNDTNIYKESKTEKLTLNQKETKNMNTDKGIRYPLLQHLEVMRCHHSL